jgi:UDPglucose 6-dehydrogenase
MREASSLTVIADLLDAGATVAAYDPVATDHARVLLQSRADVTFSESAMGALNRADALLILTEWKEFRSPDFDSIKSSLNSPVIFDGRNLYDPKLVRSLGIEYFAIGR